jgi:hypothetical protein
MEYLVVGAGVMAALWGVVVAVRSGRLSRLRRQLESYEVSLVRDVREGRVAVEGAARPAEALLHAPFSGREVIGFRVKVEQAQQKGDEYGWRTLVDECHVREFEVEDPTGRALIHPVKYQLILRRTSRQADGLFRMAPPEVLDLLRRRLQSVQRWNRLRWSEFLLEPGENVLACGGARRELDARQEVRSYREAPTRVIIAAPSRGTLLIADQHHRELIGSLSEETDLPPRC